MPLSVSVRYNVTHIVLDVQELERDSVDITAINGIITAIMM